MPVVIFSTGKQEHKVQDVIFDPKKNMVVGLLVDEGGWFGTAKVLPLDRVKSIGEDAVIIEAADAIQNADSVPSIQQVMDQENVLKGTKLMTESGKDLGTLVDISFDEVTGKVEGYEVSGGMMADMYGVRSTVPASESLRLGEDVAFVPDSTLDILEAQTGGLKGVAQQAGSKVQGATDSAKDAMHSPKAADSVDKAKSSVGDAAGKVKEGAHNLMDTVSAKASEYKDKAMHEMEDRSIKKAVGHPASRVVMDHQNNVIVNTGDIITFESVESARTAGVLDILLSSVYDKDPSLTTEDMKAKQA